ncbi:MAG: hypothetical protein PUD63_02925 [Clostridia bacterium]|nr:hypothetical protein [Clostridia bacterium]
MSDQIRFPFFPKPDGPPMPARLFVETLPGLWLFDGECSLNAR